MIYLAILFIALLLIDGCCPPNKICIDANSSAGEIIRQRHLDLEQMQKQCEEDISYFDNEITEKYSEVIEKDNQIRQLETKIKELQEKLKDEIDKGSLAYNKSKSLISDVGEKNNQIKDKYKEITELQNELNKSKQLVESLRSYALVSDVENAINKLKNQTDNIHYQLNTCNYQLMVKAEREKHLSKEYDKSRDINEELEIELNKCKTNLSSCSS